MSDPIDVLVVDDERDVELLFRQRFRREIRTGAISLHFAFSGKEALAYLQEHRADVVLVLSDINMPGMTGLELLRQIRSLPPPPDTPLPVCMMTAYGDDEYRRKAEEFGSDGYLTKPIDFDALKAKLEVIAREAS